MFFSGGFPFGDMGGGMPGGMPGGMGHPRSPSEPVDTESFYRTMGVEKNSSTEDIKKAFKRMAIKHHPDKGGDQEKFKEICRAYEVLSDPEKRKVYDQYGEKGLDGSPQGDASDIFDLFFGGGGRRQRGPPRGEDVQRVVEFTLEDFYKGAEKKLSLTKDIICQPCSGNGGPESAFQECSDCNGRGVKLLIRRMGPIVSQSQQPCSTCRTAGRIMPEERKCKNCGGKGTVKDKKILTVRLDKGAPDEHRVVFASEADEKPGTVAGDVVFVCKQKPHPVFKRINCDLFMEKEITLLEALTGTSFYLTHLDGTKRFVQTGGSQVVSQGMLLSIEEAGMPMHGSPFVFGNIYIKFAVRMPTKQLTGEAAALLAKVLPRPAPVSPVTDDVEKHVLTHVDPDQLRRRQQAQAQQNEDDDEGMGGSGVQCRQA